MKRHKALQLAGVLMIYIPVFIAGHLVLVEEFHISPVFFLVLYTTMYFGVAISLIATKEKQ